jgi:hypothetical protein
VAHKAAGPKRRRRQVDRDLLAERDAILRQMDAETIARYERLHARYQEYRRGVPRLAEQMREAAPEYTRAVWRERALWDAEQSVLDRLEWDPSAA